MIRESKSRGVLDMLHHMPSNDKLALERISPRDENVSDMTGLTPIVPLERQK